VVDNINDIGQHVTGLHAFGFSGKGECALQSSEGDFSVEEWEEAYDVAQSHIMGGRDLAPEDMDSASTGTREWLTAVLSRETAATS